MLRIAAGLVLLLALPALADDDKPKDKDKPKAEPKTPAEQVQAVIEEYEDAQRDFSKAYRAAKTSEERQKVIQEKNPDAGKFAPRLFAIAEKHPKDAAAVDALVWVVTNIYDSGKDSPRGKALGLLLKEHVQSDKLERVCQALGNGMNADEETFLRAVVEKNKTEEVRGEALLALGQRLGQSATMARRLKGDAKMAEQYTQYYGKEKVEELLKSDPAKVETESEQLYRQFAQKHMARLKGDRLTALVQRFGYSADKGGELVLRTLLDKNAMIDVKREVQGMATLALGQLLKKRAEGLPEAEAKNVEKEAEQTLETAVAKFADVKAGFRDTTVGDRAKAELFELRHLAKGMVAPEIEAEDLDAQKFKLSDYKGKVVLIDFWGNW